MIGSPISLDTDKDKWGSSAIFHHYSSGAFSRKKSMHHNVVMPMTLLRVYFTFERQLSGYAFMKNCRWANRESSIPY